MRFLKDLYEVRDRAREYILEVVGHRETWYNLCDPEDDDAIYDMPQAEKYSEKYGNTTMELGYIYTVNKEGGCDLYCPEGEDQVINLSQCSTDVVCQIADIIYSLENPE